jgi:hypothetical protein
MAFEQGFQFSRPTGGGTDRRGPGRPRPASPAIELYRSCRVAPGGCQFLAVRPVTIRCRDSMRVPCDCARIWPDGIRSRPGGTASRLESAQQITLVPAVKPGRLFRNRDFPFIRCGDRTASLYTCTGGLAT